MNATQPDEWHELARQEAQQEISTWLPAGVAFEVQDGFSHNQQREMVVQCLTQFYRHVLDHNQVMLHFRHGVGDAGQFLLARFESCLETPYLISRTVPRFCYQNAAWRHGVNGRPRQDPQEIYPADPRRDLLHWPDLTDQSIRQPTNSVNARFYPCRTVDDTFIEATIHDLLVRNYQVSRCRLQTADLASFATWCGQQKTAKSTASSTWSEPTLVNLADIADRHGGEPTPTF